MPTEGCRSLLSPSPPLLSPPLVGTPPPAPEPEKLPGGSRVTLGDYHWSGVCRYMRQKHKDQAEGLNPHRAAPPTTEHLGWAQKCLQSHHLATLPSSHFLLEARMKPVYPELSLDTKTQNHTCLRDQHHASLCFISMTLFTWKTLLQENGLIAH